MSTNMTNKTLIYDAALAKWGFDAQVIAAIEECNELSAALARYLNHKTNALRVSEEAADVEIMLEQLRHNGFNEMIEGEKTTRLARLARRVGVGEKVSFPSDIPNVATLFNESVELLGFAQAHVHAGTAGNWRKASSFIRAGIGRQMMIAQLCIREAQRIEHEKDVHHD